MKNGRDLIDILDEITNLAGSAEELINFLVYHVIPNGKAMPDLRKQGSDIAIYSELQKIYDGRFIVYTIEDKIKELCRLTSKLYPALYHAAAEQ